MPTINGSMEPIERLGGSVFDKLCRLEVLVVRLSTQGRTTDKNRLCVQIYFGHGCIYQSVELAF
jgi:hypothetical protein